MDFTDTSELTLEPHNEAWGSDRESFVLAEKVWSVSGVPGRGIDVSGM